MTTGVTTDKDFVKRVAEWRLEKPEVITLSRPKIGSTTHELLDKFYKTKNPVTRSVIRDIIISRL